MSSEEANGYTRRSQRKREGIITASIHCFRERGILQVSMDEIAERARVSKVTIYKYFSAKEKLVQQVMAHFFTQVTTEYTTILHTPAPFSEKLEQYMAVRLRIIREGWPGIAVEAESLYPGLREWAQIEREKLLELLLAMFRAGKREGAVKPGISEEMIALHFKVLLSYLSGHPELVAPSAAEPAFYHDYLKMYWSPIIATGPGSPGDRTPHSSSG